MKINIAHVAKLANLSIDKSEETKFESQLANVLGYIERLNEVDTTGVEETSQVTGLENVTRDDKPDASLPQDVALSQAKNTHNHLFAVKGIFADE
ncbi:MAG TPA: Asp-tRNA(Asn)/Glu-tRNA(Gln) amidotransferase subunit GatC [Patescibacteria group bacterium]|nr:Asp-tRNA(Asn)/Glu-tRNA(Gln) amidotransferase subunit GatC [Patescibacteria group bacterium]